MTIRREKTNVTFYRTFVTHSVGIYKCAKSAKIICVYNISIKKNKYSNKVSVYKNNQSYIQNKYKETIIRDRFAKKLSGQHSTSVTCAWCRV